MKTVNFLFGIHNHQPVGNFDFVFEEAFQKSYKPFIDVLEQYPNIAMSLHYSGCLLEWLEEHHPEYLDRIGRLVARGNIEIMSGGFYEPILAVIPDSDKIGQIKKLTRYIRDRFDYEAEGLWLTERVWEPHLAKSLNEAGIKYITVDDAHFISAGKRERELTGYFHTEEQGRILDIFPIKQKLRYLIPFEDPQRTIDLMREFATEEGDNALVMADDGEKFGIWPGTYETVYEHDWLNRFFQALEDNRDWLKTQTFKEYHTEFSAKGRVYLPTGSYFEMGEWTLPAHMGEKFENWVHHLEETGELEEYQPFLKGGIWRNFFAKYEESNWIHKRVLGALEDMQRKIGDPEFDHTRDELWRATCNCAYWHGIFGGLYLPHLRDALYRHLLSGEQDLYEDTLNGVNWLQRDVDRDGNNEVICRTSTFQAFWKPSLGASMVELDYLPKQFNVSNTLRRYRESYHVKVLNANSSNTSNGNIHDMFVAKEDNLEKFLQYDTHPRNSFLDHFIRDTVTLEELKSGEYIEQGDFLTGEWNTELQNQSTVRFFRQGTVNGQDFAVTKMVIATEDTQRIQYQLKNISGEHLETLFMPECNFTMLGGHSEERYFLFDGQKPEHYHLDTEGRVENLKSVRIVNEWDGFQIVLEFDRSLNLWQFPVYTVSMSDSGFERVYQESVLLPRFDISLEPGESREITVDLRLTELSAS